jgi:hypothetical protein
MTCRHCGESIEWFHGAWITQAERDHVTCPPSRDMHHAPERSTQ